MRYSLTAIDWLVRFLRAGLLDRGKCMGCKFASRAVLKLTRRQVRSVKYDEPAPNLRSRGTLECSHDSGHIEQLKYLTRIPRQLERNRSPSVLSCTLKQLFLGLFFCRSHDEPKNFQCLVQRVAGLHLLVRYLSYLAKIIGSANESVE